VTGYLGIYAARIVKRVRVPSLLPSATPRSGFRALGKASSLSWFFSKERLRVLRSPSSWQHPRWNIPRGCLPDRSLLRIPWADGRSLPARASHPAFQV